jgi:hypothetical protein
MSQSSIKSSYGDLLDTLEQAIKRAEEDSEALESIQDAGRDAKVQYEAARLALRILRSELAGRARAE